MRLFLWRKSAPVLVDVESKAFSGWRLQIERQEPPEGGLVCSRRVRARDFWTLHRRVNMVLGRDAMAGTSPR